MRLINFKCPSCGYEEDFFEDELVHIGQTDIYYFNDQLILCDKCKSIMNKFDFKNNSQRWKYCDAE